MTYTILALIGMVLKGFSCVVLALYRHGTPALSCQPMLYIGDKQIKMLNSTRNFHIYKSQIHKSQHITNQINYARNNVKLELFSAMDASFKFIKTYIIYIGKNAHLMRKS